MKRIFLLVVLAAAIAVLLYGRDVIYRRGPLETTVNVVIPRGAGSAGVASKLAEAGVVDSPLWFRIAARLYQTDKYLKAGEYQFSPRVSMYEVMEKLRRGEVFYRRITIPEGLYSAQIADAINEVPELSGEISAEIAEGSLLPETYTYAYGDPKMQIITQAQAAMDKVLAEAWNGRDENLPLKSPEELLILASIIEKETGVPAERGQVASVFVNRLKKGMKLQTDPTVIYALTQGKGELGRNLSRADLQIDSPYNTYKYYGLPPAPICNPGRESIMAAAHPEVTEYLYFVANGQGGHHFSTSLAEHNRKVREWVNFLRKK